MHANHPLWCLLFGDTSKQDDEKSSSEYDSFAQREPLLVETPTPPIVHSQESQLFRRAPKISPNNYNNAMECLMQSFLEKTNLIDDLNFVIANLQPKTFSFSYSLNGMFDQFINLHTDGSWPFGMEPVRLFLLLNRLNYPIRYFQHPGMRDELMKELHKTAKFISHVEIFAQADAQEECQNLIDFQAGKWYTKLQKDLKSFIYQLDVDITDKATIQESWPFGCDSYSLTRFLARLTELTTFLARNESYRVQEETFTGTQPFPDYTMRESLLARLKMLDFKLSPIFTVALSQQKQIDAMVDSISHSFIKLK
jgi:hypothetical protein